MGKSKVLACLLTLAMLVSCIPVGVFAADEDVEVGDAIFYNRTYDEEGVDGFANLVHEQKSNQIIIDEEKDGNKYIHMISADPTTEDFFIDVNMPNPTRFIMIETSLAQQKPGVKVNLDFKDPTRADAGICRVDESGNVISNGSGDTIGQLKDDEWLDLAFALDLENMTFSTYVDGELVEEDQKVGGSTTNEMILIRWYIGPQGNGSDLMVDNFRVYEGTEPRDISGEDIKAPDNTFKPSATPTPTSSAGPVQEEEKTTILDVNDKKAIEAIGLEADKEVAAEADYSAKAELTDTAKMFTIEDIPHDVRGFTSIKFYAYNPGEKDAGFYLRLLSDNPATTDGEDYYGVQCSVPPGEWTEFNIPISSLSKSRSPLGYDQISKLQVFLSGWTIENEIGTVINFDSIYFDVEEVQATPTPTPKPVDLSRVENAVCLKLNNPYALVNKVKVPIDPDSKTVVPYTENDRTLVPFRFVGESLGAEVSYDGSQGVDKVTIKRGSDTIELTVGEAVMYKNGTAIQLDTAATITGDDRTFVPLRAIAEAFGKEVFWDDMGMIVISDTKDIFNRETDLDLMLDIMTEYTYERPTGEQMVADLKANSPSHPRILATKADFERVKQTMQTDTVLADWVEQMRARADVAVANADTKPVHSVDAGGRFSGTDGSGVIPMALMYQLTGDQKYVDASYKQLSVICTEYPNWHPGHFLNAAGIMQNVAICYDWLYEGLTDEQRTVIEDGLYEFGVKAGIGSYEGATDNLQTPQFSTWHRSGWIDTDNNWNAVCNAGITIAAIAIADVDRYQSEAEKALGYTIRGIEKGVTCYAPDGGYAESTGYWSYGTTNLSLMIAALDSAMGTDYGIFNAPGLDVTGYFPNYMEGPTGTFNYHDASEGFTGTETLMWFGKKLKNPDLSGIRYNDVVSGKKGLSVYDIIFYDKDNLNPDVHLPLDKVFTGIDTASMRSSWTDDGAIFVGLHGGYNKVNHCNIDVGQFVLDAGGKRWFIDLGGDNYNAPGYFSTGEGGQRWTYYTQRAEGHNTLVINPDSGEDQILESTSKIIEQVSKPKGAYTKLDMTPAYADDVTEAKRGIWLTDNRNAVIIQDEVTMPSESEVWWFAHTRANITLSEDKKSAILDQGGKRLWVGITSPIADAVFEVMDPEPLPTSPQADKSVQNSRAGIKKLAIHVEGVKEYDMAVMCKLLTGDETVPDLSYTWTDMDSWSIPDGEIIIPTLSELTVNGESVADFNADTTSYKFVLPYGTTEIPTVAAVPGGDYNMEITQISALPGTASIRVSAKDDPRMYRIYEVSIRVQSDIEVTASDVPEPANVPENTMDLDLTTRWAAQGEQWIRYDFANPREISSVWIAFWKSDARSTIFNIQVSEDGENFKTVFDGQQTNKEDQLAEYKFDPVTVKAVKINCFGTTAGDWNSILEVDFK